ncbi:phage tail length tape measure family protein [Massilia antarctica]|uniref:phage tail length tape measure family protein n=1 Tax=Massilia antarctica TaxID=2765360 RepID=UPI00226DB639|nr:phage tail length tape measure family protein [Massilia sp. H27-R4]MCY0910832.1 phage tail length tape measure family protein [Massilia sp. H27-R4]
MPDIAELGLSIDTRPLEDGTRAMDAFGEASIRVEQKTRAVNGQMNDTAAMMRTAAQAARAAEDANNRLLAGLQREIDLFGANRAETERYNAAMAGMTSSTQRQAAALGAKIDAMRRDEQAARDLASASEKAAQAGDRFISNLKDQVATLGMTTQQLQAYRAAQLGVSDAATPLIAKLGEAGAGAHATGKHMEGLNFQTVGARRELLVLAHELSQGNYQKFGGSMMVLGEQTGAAGLLFSAAGIAALSLAAAVAAVGYAMIKGISEQKHMNDALIMTGGYAGVTGDKLNELAHAAVEAGGSIGEAKKAATELAASGKFTGEQIGYITEAVVGIEHATGKSIEKTIKEFESLAVQTTGSSARATEAISRQTVKLDDTYHFLTESVYEQIRALEKEGNAKEASALAMEVYAKAQKDRTDQILENVGSIAHAWHGVKEAIGGAMDVLGNIGKKATPGSEVKRLSGMLQDFDQGLAGSNERLGRAPNAMNEGTERARTKLVLELTDAVEKLNKANAAANAQGAKSLAESEAVHAASRITMDNQKLQKKGLSELTIAMDAYHEDIKKIKAVNPDSILLTPAAIAAHEAALTKAHTVAAPKAKVDKAENTGMNDRMARVQDEVNAEKMMIEQLSRVDDLWHKAGLLSDAEFYKNKRDYATAAANEEVAGFNAQLAILRAHHSATEAEKASNVKRVNDIVGKKAVAEQRSADAIFLLDQQEMLRKDATVNAADVAGMKEIASINAQVAAVEQQIRTYNLLPAAKTAVAIADLEEQSAALAGFENSEKAIELNNRKIESLRNLAAAQGRMSKLETGSDVAKAKEMLDILTAVDTATKSAAASMSNSFGRVGSAIGGLTTALSGYAVQQQAIAAQLAAAKADPKNGAEKIAQAEIAASRASAQAKVKSYGDMAGAAKGFFKENSTGYKVLEGTEKAFRAFEMAMVLKSMAVSLFATSTKATGVVAGQSVETSAVTAGESARNLVKVPGVFMSFMSSMGPWGAAAAGVAIAAVLGSAFSGGGTGGGKSAAEVQKKQGSGSVFGDTDAKSESIARSLAMLEDHSGSLVPINRGMLAALRSIEASMKGLTNLIVRAPGVADGSNLGIQTGQLNIGKATDGVSKVMTEVTKGLFGPGLGDKIASFINNIWGKTKQTIVDSGIQFGGSVRDLQGGKGYDQYASVDTTRSMFFGLSKRTNNALQTAGLEGGLPAQFGLVFKGVETALNEAATVLGVGADHVKSTLDALTIDVTQISLKGLTGDALTTQLNAVLSKAMDGMSEAVFPNMDSFSEAGEGYTETIVRLASNYATLDANLNSIGLTFGAAGVSSLRAREDLIAAAGGVDKLSEKIGSFSENFLTEGERLAPVQKHVTEELARLGQAGIKTRDDFKAAVLGLSEGGKLATTAGAELFTGLMALESAFAAVVPSLEKTKTAAEKLSERESLIDRRDDLKMSPAELATKSRSKVDKSNWDVYDEVSGLELANKNRALEIQNMELAGNKLGALAATRADEIKGLDASTAELVKRRNALEDANTAAALATKNRAIEIQNMELVGNKSAALAASRAQELVGLEASTTALIKNRNALQDQAAAAALAVTGANGALTGLKNSVGAQKDILNQQYDAQVKAIKDSTPTADSYKGQIDAAKKLTDAVKSVFDKISSALESTEIQSTAMDAARRRAAQELLAQAAVFTRGGGTGNVAGLDDALAAISKPSEDMFATFEDYARDQNRAKASLEALQANAKKELDYGQLTVDGLEAMSKTVDAASNAQLKLLSENHISDLARLDAMVTAGQKEIDAVTGVDTSVKSLADAIKEFAAAIKGVKDAPSGLSVEGLYQQVLGRDGEKAGVDFWKKAYGETVDGAEKADFIKNAQPELEAKRTGKWAEFLRSHGVPGYATGGDFGGGMRLVGENGPELEATGPARIFNAGQARSMLSGGSPELIEEVRRLTATVARQQVVLERQQEALDKTATNTKRLADAFETVTDGNNAMRTKEQA